MEHARTWRASGLLVLGLIHCGESSRPPLGFEPDASASAAPAVAPPAFDPQLVEAGTTERPVLAHLTGRVVAPEGTIPIANALVYLSKALPPPLPTKVYCDECVALSASDSYAVTNPDGTFDLGAKDLGALHLVVQKGAFRRVRPVAVVAGSNEVDQDDTRLPSRTNTKAGDTAPRVLVAYGNEHDQIHHSLEALGLEIDAADITSVAELALKPKKVDDYHIVFLPCSGAAEIAQGSGAIPASVVTALREYVKKGGRLYVTDYSYDFVKAPFPKHLSWQNEGSGLCSACSTVYDAPGTSNDKTLTAWLSAQGITDFALHDNWTAVTETHAAMSFGADGKAKKVEPKIWVHAKKYDFDTPLPATLSFEYGCGRVLFSTYHTEESGQFDQLSVQEKILLHIVLEVGVCTQSESGVVPPAPT